MNNIDIYDLLNSIAYERVSGSDKEKECAVYIKNVISNYNIDALLDSFELSAFNTTINKLIIDGIEYKSIAYNNTTSCSFTAPFYYMESSLYNDSNKINGSIVLINGRLNETIYKKLIDNNAKAFITFSGDILDNESNSDLETRELFPYLAKYGIIPGVNIRVADAISIVKSNPKYATMEIETSQFVSSSQNVICEIEGTVYKDEVICITAHYDSVLHSSGAYDNGAGCALILKYLEHLTINKPSRTVRFIFCGSEERGLLGSKHYVKMLSEEELKKIVFNINVDVAGSILGVDYISAISNASLVNYLEYLCKIVGFNITIKQDIYSSDSMPFSKSGIPSINFMRFGATGSAHIHDRHDTMSFISRDSLNKTYSYIEYICDNLINSVCFPVDREIPTELKNKILEYFHEKGTNNGK